MTHHGTGTSVAIVRISLFRCGLKISGRSQKGKHWRPQIFFFPSIFSSFSAQTVWMCFSDACSFYFICNKLHSIKSLRLTGFGKVVLQQRLVVYNLIRVLPGKRSIKVLYIVRLHFVLWRLSVRTISTTCRTVLTTWWLEQVHRLFDTQTPLLYRRPPKRSANTAWTSATTCLQSRKMCINFFLFI